MKTPPTAGQIVLVLGACALFTAGGIASFVRLRAERRWLRVLGKSLDYWAILLTLGALVWHCAQRGSALPLEDNFEALAALGELLSCFEMYIQRVRPIPGLDGFLTPIIVLMLVCAVVFGRVTPDAYQPDSLWSWAHRLSSYGGALGFAVAAAMGGLYLVNSARLRRKAAPLGPKLGGNLERLENGTQTAVTLGFALLTLGMLTGLLKILHDGSHTQLGAQWYLSPKVILAFAVWIVYAVALHTPITPSVRGRKSAMLSIVGFVLMFATMVAVQLVPNGK